MFTNDNMPHGGDAARGEGTIRRLITDRGFGFIRPMSSNGAMRKDLFFHAAQVVGVRYEELREDDIVSYTIADDPRGKGPVATEVRRGVRAVGPGDAPPDRWQALAAVPADDYDAADDTTEYDWGTAS